LFLRSAHLRVIDLIGNNGSLWLLQGTFFA